MMMTLEIQRGTNTGLDGGARWWQQRCYKHRAGTGWWNQRDHILGGDTG